MPDLRENIFKMLGVQANESFGLYDQQGNFRGNFHVSKELALIPEQVVDYRDSCISILGIIKGYFEIGKLNGAIN